MPGADVGGLLRYGVASCCLAAGALHMSAAADHRGMASHVAFFVLVAVAQSAVAAAVLWARPDRWLAVAAVVNVAVAAVWMLSRTFGLPVGGTSAPEAIGFKDGISTVLELGAATGATMWWILTEPGRQVALSSRRFASTLLGTGVWALGAAGLFAGHTHSAGHTHGAGHHDDAAHAPATAHSHQAATAHDVPDHEGGPHGAATHGPAHRHGPSGSPGGLPDGQAAHHHDAGSAAGDRHDHPVTPEPTLAAGTAAPHGHGAAGHTHHSGHHREPASSETAGSVAAPAGGGHDHGDGHHHPDGSGDHPHRSRDPAPGPDRGRTPPEQGRGDEDGDASPLDEILKLIRQSTMRRYIT